MLSVSMVFWRMVGFTVLRTCLAKFRRIIFRVVEENRININITSRVLEILIVAVLVNKYIRIRKFFCYNHSKTTDTIFYRIVPVVSKIVHRSRQQILPLYVHFVQSVKISRE